VHCVDDAEGRYDFARGIVGDGEAAAGGLCQIAGEAVGSTGQRGKLDASRQRTLRPVMATAGALPQARIPARPAFLSSARRWFMPASELL
jgi:hypothetical protein